ncbi:hypothetical protein NAT51_02975 [Flavobacterium amniphilum]|uniref:hypothetical protein n=1 Tax=Flavobacterium amniphilum TaxID=1834035 RepID=UPI00202A365B|nr:hypothetical protein [Flavobacterium amniphilum]MCL9804468.1 hypothetical protein [Flavobacterium amniphilum]
MLELRVKNRIEWFCKNKVNEFSPTISPAPKYLPDNEIESIRQAVNYFLSRGETELVVQKKYMGSYCTIYLKNKLEETYFVSRNGYRIEHIDTEAAQKSIVGLHQKMLEMHPGFDAMIIASEMLPWKIMGGNLIEKEYCAYYEALDTHNAYLQNSDLYAKISRVKQKADYTAYVDDKKNLSGKEFKSKHKSHIVRQYEALGQFKLYDLETQAKSLDIFREQIEIFGGEGEIHFKPFNILKIVYDSGKEVIPNSNLTYASVNDDAFLHLRFTPENEEDEVNKIKAFMEMLTAQNEEGIMIKTVKSYVKGLPPCFKIRNNKYLTMIYGVNFDTNFEHYLDKRNIKKKLEQSINDWEINRQMLEIPYKNLNEENYLMKLLLLKRINNEEIEKKLDPRL